jgi:hypothetical protein
MWKAMYLALGVLVARWFYHRRIEGDTLTRLREIGGV